MLKKILFSLVFIGFGHAAESAPLQLCNAQKIIFPDVILFDWDDTIAEFRAVWNDVLNETRIMMGAPAMTKEEILAIPCLEQPQDRIMEWMFPHNADAAKQQYWENYNRIIPNAPVKIAQSTIDLLTFLKEKGVYMVVVSGKKQEPLEETVARSGIAHLFDRIIGSYRETPLVNKPHIGVVKRALEATQFESYVEQETPLWWVIGDARVDLETALNAKSFPVYMSEYTALDPKRVTFTDDASHPMGLLVTSWADLSERLKNAC